MLHKFTQDRHILGQTFLNELYIVDKKEKYKVMEYSFLKKEKEKEKWIS